MIGNGEGARQLGRRGARERERRRMWVTMPTCDRQRQGGHGSMRGGARDGVGERVRGVLTFKICF